MKQISDEEILKLWRNPDFEGSYRGIKVFRLLLKTNYDIDVSEKRLYNIIKHDSIYLLHKKPNRKIARRFYDVTYYGEVVQMDLASMYEYDSYKYFILAIDIYTSKCFVEPMKTKTSLETAQCLKKIIKEFGAPITTIESDQGGEFGRDVKKLMNAEHIVAKFKFGKNKSSVAEHYLYLVKRREYMLLRGTLSRDWVSNLQPVCESFNNTPLKRLGWLKPNDIKSFKDSILVHEAKLKHNIPILTQPLFQTQEQNQKTYEANSKNTLQENSYCYLDFNSSVFDKAYDVSVRKNCGAVFTQNLFPSNLRLIFLYSAVAKPTCYLGGHIASFAGSKLFWTLSEPFTSEKRESEKLRHPG